MTNHSHATTTLLTSLLGALEAERLQESLRLVATGRAALGAELHSELRDILTVTKRQLAEVAEAMPCLELLGSSELRGQVEAEAMREAMLVVLEELGLL